MIISMYAKGMSTRDINAHMYKIYQVDVSADMVSAITDKILPIAREWQHRPLKEFYAILYLDGVVFNVCKDGQVVKKTAYVVTAIDIDGKRDVLGIWIGEAESAKFWLSVVVDINNRGVKDILIAAIDGLKGFEEAIASVFSQTEIQRCIVHQIRYSARFVGWKERKAFCKDMKLIYTSPNEEAGIQALDRFEEIWGKKYSYAVKSWRSNWKSLSTFFRYPAEIRRIIYTTNSIEGFNRILRKATKNKSSFPTDDSLFKMLYLVVMDSTEKWQSVRDWSQIINQLSVYFGERVTKHL
jgi:transposase-like protein